MNFDELVHYLSLGGFTLAIILASSFISVAIAIERVLVLWRASEDTRTLGEAIAKHLLRGDVPSARATAERSTAVAAEIYLAGFERLDKNLSVAAAVERARTQVGLSLKKRLWVLGTVGATAPFVGLFGTVAGIMRSFKDLGLDVQAGGTGGSAAVMIGISEALVATAAGILVAVEAVVLYNYFQSRLGRISVELKLLADEFVELLLERPKSAPVEVGASVATASTPTGS